MDREEKLLFHLKKDGVGVEIGASHSPIAPKKAGYNVHVIDHATREQLAEKYKDERVNLDNIEDVDFVWTGESYADLTGKANFYDWIIASHVVEHTPNLIGFINSCDEILNDTGVLSLAVPDSRFCFDHFRPLTGLSRILDAHYQDHTAHTNGSIAEFNLNLVSKDGYPGWGENIFLKEEYAFSFSKEKVLETIDASVNRTGYIDCHAWCFSPHSFRLMMHDLYELGFIRMREVGFFPDAGCEFHIALSRNGKGSSLSRLEMLQAINLEILKASEPNLLFKTGLARMKEKARQKFRELAFRNIGLKNKERLKNLARHLGRSGK